MSDFYDIDEDVNIVMILYSVIILCSVTVIVGILLVLLIIYC